MANGNHNNNGHHRNGTGNDLVHSPPRTGYGVNGNGHRPETAPVSSTGQAIVPDHDLLWDGLPPAVTHALGQPLDPALVSQRRGRAGRTFSYIEGHVAISEANRVFGFGGWGYELVADVTLQGDRERRSPDRRGEAHSRLQRTGSGHRTRARLPAPTSASTP